MATDHSGVIDSQIVPASALSEASPATREEIIAAGLNLEPKEALGFHNGDQASRCTTKVFTCLVLPDGTRVDLHRDEDGRVGCAYSRVSTVEQRSRHGEPTFSASGDGNKNGVTERAKSAATLAQSAKAVSGEDEIDLDQKAEPQNRDEMRGKPQDTAYSEKEQIERGVDYFIERRQAFFIVSDSGLSGGWPWMDKNLIHDLYTAKAIRYHKVYRKLILDNPKYREQREAAQRYLDTRMEQIIASVREFPADSTFAEKYLRPGREKLRATTRTIKYRPGLTNLVKKLPMVHTVAAADLSRLFRNYDLQVQFGRALQRSGTQVVGTFDTLDWLNSADEDDDGKGDRLFGNQLTGMVLGKIAEMRLYEVMTGAMRGMIQMLEDGAPHGIVPAWMRRTPRGIAIVPEARAVVLRCVELYEEGLGATAIMGRLIESGYTASPLSHNSIKRWLENPLLVGDQEAFGIVWRDVAPAILLDSEGRPDRYRFSKLQEMRRQRFEADPRFRINRKHPSERHLGAGVAVCVCGKSIVYDGQKAREGEHPMKRMPYYHCNANAHFLKLHPHHRVSLNPENFHNFLKYLIFTEGEKVIQMLSDSRERDYLMEEVRALEAKARERAADLEEKKRSELVYQQALSRAKREADEDGIEVDEESITHHMKRLLKPDAVDLQRVEGELARKRRELGAYVLPEQIETLRQQIASAATMTEPELNALVLSLLKLYFDDTDGGKHSHDPHNLKCRVQWNIAAQALIPVPLKIRWRGSKRDVRLPEASWLETRYLSEKE